MDNHCNYLIFFIHIEPLSSPLPLCTLLPLHIFTLTVSFLCFLNLCLWFFHICPVPTVTVFLSIAIPLSLHLSVSFSLLRSSSLPPSLSACSVATGILLFQMKCWIWNWGSWVPPVFSAHIHITISILHHHYHIFFHFLLHLAVHVWFSSECHFGVKSQRCSLC